MSHPDILDPGIPKQPDESKPEPGQVVTYLTEPDEAKVCALLIGERPGLARAESMSIYMGYSPKPDSTDANRDVVCNIYEGGLNPLEGGALAVQIIQKMIKYQTSGVDLKLVEK